jgi:hypothetical protein
MHVKNWSYLGNALQCHTVAHLFSGSPTVNVLQDLTQSSLSPLSTD